MAVDMFLKLDDIKGESSDKSHKETIDILAWSWGASNATSAHSGGGSGTGKVNVGDISITKYVDKSSAYLMTACFKGTHFKKAEVIVRKAGGSPLEYIILTLEEVFVSSVNTGGSGGEDRLTENITLSYGKFSFKYTEQDEKGAKGKDHPFKWDIKANAESK
jgi:type VI secretion system secreted protein Hcp